MVIIRKSITDEITAEIELSDETEFFTRCQKCGKLVEATDEIIDDFGEFLFNSSGIICEKCAAKSNNLIRRAK